MKYVSINGTQLKKMYRTLFTITLLFVCAFYVTAQNYETRKVGYYDAIKVSHGIEVVLVKGDPGTLKVRTNGIDPDDIVTEVEWETLKIRFRNISIWDEDKYDRRDVTIEVPFSEMKSIDGGTGALIKSKSVVKGEELRVEAGMGAEIYLELDVDLLRAEISMGSILESSGMARNQRLKVNMGAVMDHRSVDSEYVTVKASMGGEIKVTASKEVDASANMGGMISVYGDPDKRYVSNSFGGEVNFSRIN